jgi:hypothetical protein
MKSDLSSLRTADSVDERLTQIVEEAFTRLQAGAAIDIDALVAAHPDFAEQLRELVPTIGALMRLRSPAAVDDDAKGGNGALVARLQFHQLGDFRVLRELGHGGMGTVFEAEQISMRRRVALKVLPLAALAHDKSIQRFRNEVRAAAALDHPHIVSVYSVGEERGIHFYAMQLIRGQSLAELIHELRATRCREVSAISERGGTSPDQLAGPTERPTIESTAALSPSTNRGLQAGLSTAADSRRKAQRYRAAVRWAFRQPRPCSMPTIKACFTATSSRAI